MDDFKVTVKDCVGDIDIYPTVHCLQIDDRVTIKYDNDEGFSKCTYFDKDSVKEITVALN